MTAKKVVKEASYKIAIKEVLENEGSKSKTIIEQSKEKWTKTNRVEIKNYMLQLNKKQSEMIFRIRSRMVMVKGNMKSSYKDLSCRFCNEDIEETQSHFINECTANELEVIRNKYKSKEEEAFNTDTQSLVKLANMVAEMVIIVPETIKKTAQK